MDADISVDAMQDLLKWCIKIDTTASTSTKQRVFDPKKNQEKEKLTIYLKIASNPPALWPSMKDTPIDLTVNPIFYYYHEKYIKEELIISFSISYKTIIYWKLYH